MLSGTGLYLRVILNTSLVAIKPPATSSVTPETQPASSEQR